MTNASTPLATRARPERTGWTEREPKSKAARDRRTVALLSRARQGSRPAARRLEEEAVRLNMSLARQLAGRYAGRSIAADDLEQVAYLGLVKAVRRFDPSKNKEFLGFAVPTIRGELRKHFRDVGWTVRPPRRIQELQAQVWAAESDLTQELGHVPSAAEIADHLEVSVDDVLEAASVDGCFNPTSLDVPTPGGTTPMVERRGEEDPGFETAEATVVLAPLVRRLAQRDRRILELRFFRGWTQAEIGNEVGVTQMQVSRLLSRILSDLREGLSEEDPGRTLSTAGSTSA